MLGSQPSGPSGALSVSGVWLMAAPAVLGHDARAATNLHVVGPLVATVAAAEAMRGLRWVNVALGLWLVAAAFALGGLRGTALHDAAAGFAIAGLACVRGARREQVGGGWAALLRGPSEGPPR